MDDEIQVTKDAHGKVLSRGDAVISTQNLTAGSMKIQKGTKVKNIRLDENDTEVFEGKIDGVMMVLKCCFFKKVD